MLMTNICTKFHVPNFSDSSVTDMKLETKYNLCTDITLLFQILQKYCLNKTCTYFHDLSHIILRPKHVVGITPTSNSSGIWYTTIPNSSKIMYDVGMSPIGIKFISTFTIMGNWFKSWNGVTNTCKHVPQFSQNVFFQP